jgi:hypothetical protein
MTKNIYDVKGGTAVAEWAPTSAWVGELVNISLDTSVSPHFLLIDYIEYIRACLNLYVERNTSGRLQS